MSNLYEYWMSLSDSEKINYSNKCDLAFSYINTHLIHKRKTPPLSKLKIMANASNGELTYHGLCDFFLAETEET